MSLFGGGGNKQQAGRGGFNQQSADELMMQGMMTNLMKQVNKNCFLECVNDYKTDSLNAKETTCIQQCAGRQSALLVSMNDI